MKIKYNKTRLKFNLNFGIAFMLFSIVTYVIEFLFTENESKSSHSTSASLFIGGFISVLYYYYEKRVQFLSIKNGVLKQHGLFGQKVKLNEIIELKEFAGDYFLKTKKKTMIIDSSVIEDESKEELKHQLNLLGLEWVKPKSL